MARPYPTTFEKEQSPMSPASATSTNTPISYKANVNRQKTKKWADAKPASYGGDDWGDDDDDYDPPPPPPPISKPTGFRQQGQAIQGQKVESPVGNKKKYGDIPPLPGAAENSPRARANSFDADDERRNFSSGTVRQPSPAPAVAPGPATRFSQITGQPSSRDSSGPPALSISTKLPAPPAAAGLRKVNNAVSPTSGSSHPEVLMPGRTDSIDSTSVVSSISDARTPSTDYQARRDYSPSAAPPPLHTRGSPAPQSATEPSSTRFPARKSSLSQSVGPDISEIMHPPQDAGAPKPWVTGHSASPSASPRSPAPQGKALPFIRPADIYRRAEEERRQSQESGRPSMDSIVGARSSERSQSPAARQLRERTSSDSLGTGGRRRASMEGDDASDPGRLKPILEPVRERKSEYGFEGYNVNDQIAESTVAEHKSESVEHEPLEIEQERRSSTSPKLPDLNRISGFGMDLFAQSKTEESQLNAVPNEEATSTTSSQVEPPPIKDPSLRNQPSLGFRSVVHQSFDRREDSSVPDTPTSRTNSEFRTTDSESTGTAGISPIMSRATSSAAPETQNHDISTSTILEVVSESKADATTGKNVASQPSEHLSHMPPSFKPGHRRDLSTPSPGNSPAKPLDLAKSAVLSPAQDAAISDPSPASSIGGDDDQLQPPRPIAEREQSFRPNLPGGWTSYATSAQSEVSEDNHAAPVPPHRNLTPPSRSTPVPSQGDEDELDITPTTTRHPLPQSALGAAILGATMTSDTADFPAAEGEDTPITTPYVETPIIQEPVHPTGSDTLQSLAPETAPRGSLDSNNALDPRVLPQLEKAPPETQLRPVIVNSVPPTPPEKDTPKITRDDDSDYFPRPPVPLKQRTEDQVEANERWEQLARPQVLPTLSTDTGPQDEENDKLRKEIIKSLSPKPSEPDTHNESMLLDPLDDQPSPDPARISSYLPREYDNYWATTTEEAAPDTIEYAPAPRVPESSTHADSPTTISVSSPANIEPETFSVQAHNSEQLLSVSRPSLQPQRFSWQASSEDVSVLPEQNDPGLSNNERQFTGYEVDREPDPEPAVDETVDSAQQDPLRSHPATDESHNARDAALIGGGAALGGAAAVYIHPSQTSEQSGRRLSLAEEKDPLVSSYPISPTPPEEQHPARLSGAHLPQHIDPQSDPSAPSASAASAPPSSVSPVNSPLQPQYPQAVKILAFKDIIAIKSPQRRIQTFDETRHRFATVDYGLDNWMMSMKAQYAEHANATASFDGLGNANFLGGSVRGKFAKAPGGAPLPIQQPYYQQYLNASSPTTPGPPVARPGPSTPVGSQQGLSPAGGSKITTHQVQAKGKELLHTAGIFGGKAGKAGKGLLAKGKNKLRGAGSGDKNSSSPPAKTERRSSWGLPLSLSRSSGRPDGSSRNSKDETTPIPTQPRQRSATLTLDTGRTPVQSQRTADIDASLATARAPEISDKVGMSGALPAIDSPTNDTSQAAAPRGIEDEVAASREPGERNSPGVPAPIGKNQPSWDPLNATPIEEEEGFQFDGHPRHHSRPMHAVDNSGDVPVLAQTPAKSGHPRHQSRPMRPADETVTLTVPAEIVTKRESSDSGDARFYDALEGPSDLSDWVVVPKEVEPQDASEAHGVLSRSTPEPAKPLDIPPPSALDRLHPFLDQEKDVNPTNVGGTNRPRGNTSTSILDRPRYSYDVPQNDRPTKARSPPAQAKIPQEYRPPPVDTKIQDVKPQMEQEPPSSTSFKGLPPIRRTSTFGLGFGSRHVKKRFPIDDEEEHTPVPLPQTQPDADPLTGGTELADPNAENGQASEITAPRHTYYTQQPQSQILPAMSPSTESQAIVGTGSSEQHQRTTSQAAHSQQMYNAAKAADFQPPVDVTRRSQDAWRPNIVTSASQIPPQPSSIKGSEASILPQRTSTEQRPSTGQQHDRTPSFTQRPDSIYNERMSRTVLNQQAKAFEVPPSSAERYPDLFRQEQPTAGGIEDGGDLPAHYYQPPIAREAAFLPRQQTNEYQLPGVGPPSNDPRAAASRRNSSLFRDLGNKIRSASRERSNSVSRDGNQHSPTKYESWGNKYAEPSVMSEESQSQNQRRNSFFGMPRASTVGMIPPQSRDSMVAQNPESRTDLLFPTQPSPIASFQDRKRSFFGSNPAEQKPKANKLSRASTSGISDEPGKRKRFSGLSSMFARSSRDSPSSKVPVTSDRPTSTRELSQHERQPIESPAPDNLHFNTQVPPQSQNGSAQQRNFLAKSFTRDSSQPRQESQSRKYASNSGFIPKVLASGNPQSTQDTRPREDSKTRKHSSAGLLSGIMGRRSNQQEKREDSSSQGSRSQGSQPQSHPNQVPPAQTYTDLQEHPARAQPTQPLSTPWQGQPEPIVQAPERGRRASREPRYDSVPIPGGYSLVRGDGNVPVATEYDPRGYNRSQQIDPQYPRDPRVSQNPAPLPGGPLRFNTQQTTPSPRPPVDQRVSDNRIDNRPENLKPVESFEQYQRSRRRLSREDLLARSPARDPEGQQRPYQLSLPGDIDDRESRESRPALLNQDIPVISPPESIRAPSSVTTSPGKVPHHSSIQRLQQPILRHPESPAGYPLPDDVAFSPINPSVKNLPPPPPPKWPQHYDNQDHHHLQLMNPDLDRSNTSRTALSGISQVSGISGPQDRLAVQNALDKEMGGGREGITPSPTPPSPSITPPRQRSPSPPKYGHPSTGADNLRRTTVDRGPSPDLYDASPRLPQPSANLGHGHGHGTRNGRGVEAASGKANLDEAQGTRRVQPNPQEEKIFYDKDRLGVSDGEDDEDPQPAAMSATSYPGQEWNPYAGVYEDEY